jgi:hypothetical protein
MGGGTEAKSGDLPGAQARDITAARSELPRDHSPGFHGRRPDGMPAATGYPRRSGFEGIALARQTGGDHAARRRQNSIGVLQAAWAKSPVDLGGPLHYSAVPVAS